MPYYTSALKPQQRPYKEYRSPGQIAYDLKRAPLDAAEGGQFYSIMIAIVSSVAFALAEYLAAKYNPPAELYGKEKAAKMKKDARWATHIVGSVAVLVSIVCAVYFSRGVSAKQASFDALKLVRP
jgi:hypothetical protein